MGQKLVSLPRGSLGAVGPELAGQLHRLCPDILFSAACHLRTLFLSTWSKGAHVTLGRKEGERETGRTQYLREHWEGTTSCKSTWAIEF